MGGMCMMWRGWRTSFKQFAICKSLTAFVYLLVFSSMLSTGYSQSVDYSGVVVLNEIHYNPSAAQGSDNAFEFIELYNLSDNAVRLDGVVFTQGIEYTFSASDSIAAGGYLVIARDSTQYPGSTQWQSGSLLNSGEAVVLQDSSGTVVDSVHYSNSLPWPQEPDGSGASLELISPTLDNSLPESWQSSPTFGGSPGLPNAEPTAPEPGLQVNPDTLRFGTVHLYSVKLLSVTISNSGRESLSITSVSLESDDDSTFTFDTGISTPVVLQAGDSLQAGIRFTPADTVRYQAELVIQSSDAGDPVFRVPLLGNGLMQPMSQFEGKLIISEIHYNPSAMQGSDSDFEFMELFNHSGTTLSLNGVALDSGIEHRFSADDSLAAGHYLLLVKNSEEYPGSMQWQTGSLLNSGETIRIVDSTGMVIDEVAYEAASPWPEEANGEGSSLELIAADMDNGYPDAWQASELSGGTPGKPNSDGIQSETTRVNTPGRDLPTSFALVQNYPNPFNAGTEITFEIPVSASVSLAVYNIIGEKIATLFDDRIKPAGRYTITWRGKNDQSMPVSSGVYFYRLHARSVQNNSNDYIAVGRMVFLK